MTDSTCVISGCDRTDHKGHGWCNKHYMRWRTHGDPTYTKRPTYGSGRRIRNDGYVDVWAPDHPLARDHGYVFEHRKVAWDEGILTDPDLHIHHRNGDKQDNRPENLEAIDVVAHQRDKHGHESGGWAGRNRAKTHCKRGHALIEGNIYASQLPARICIRCARRRARRKRLASSA